MSAERHTAEQAAGDTLSARLSASTPEAGVSGPSDPSSGPQNGAQRLGSRRNLEARAFNAVQPALHKAGQWLPMSARRAVANAVLAELAPELDVLDRVRANRERLAHCNPREVDLIWCLDLFDEALGIPTSHTKAAPAPAATEATGLRERWRAAWRALTPEQQAARLAELDADDEAEQAVTKETR